MRKLGPALLLLLLLAALTPQPAEAAFESKYVVDEKTFTPDISGQQKSFSVSGSGYVEVAGGWGAVVEYWAAPAAGAPYWQSLSAMGTVDVESVSYSLTAKVFYIDTSTGLGSWQTVEARSGSTYMQAPAVFEWYSDVKLYQYEHRYSFTLPSLSLIHI